MLAMGLIASWWAVLMLPAALLIAFAFGAVGMAVTSYMKSWQDLDLVQRGRCCRCSCSAGRSTACRLPDLAAHRGRVPAAATTASRCCAA